ncbi:glycerate kinase [Halalkalibacterium halodurans]|uniref:Glycerate kinase n=1 Tax=Halalkalibacterium halodurans (strain ATCC BAA-125 / DSM 18197 / FERM 7344 / JCM 9153 / C-125) TaxID=272558 RepID=GLXK_HALH5|nr:glycerate kinase [Halalkalibacterium halodurans]Q9Z9P2.2 RecName: Full=Glycerate kinase [Halalkalibacterium halodurans C-125]MED4173158.1 glycerate kinase [Halalkalibacterium halodurans]BAB04274.1 BH0555 [Halalkalibacterium halodurans C-125]
MNTIVIAPDSFKESMTALQAARAIEKGFRRVIPNANYRLIPMADGGEGTVQSIVDALQGERKVVKVEGPLGDTVEAEYGLSGDRKIAVIEMAQASGLHLVPKEKRNPLWTSTYGTGQLLIDALDEGVEQIILGIGGSATNDGGAGMAQAVGVRLLKENGEPIGKGGGKLKELARIDMSKVDPRIQQVKLQVACDVDNPLVGEKGAAVVYGPQKGATRATIRELDEQLLHFANIIEEELGKEVASIPGAGAAGGLGAGLIAFLDAKLIPGVELVLQATNFHELVKDADFVITGEGRIDQQTVYGKTPIGVAKAAKQYGVPVIAIAGSLGQGYEAVFEHGIDAAFSLVPRIMSLDEAMQQGDSLLEQAARNIAVVSSWNKST